MLASKSTIFCARQFLCKTVTLIVLGKCCFEVADLSFPCRQVGGDYAQKHPDEDFAETFAFYHLHQRGARYMLYPGPGRPPLDLMARFRSQAFLQKRAFLEALLGTLEQGS